MATLSEDMLVWIGARKKTIVREEKLTATKKKLP